MLQSATVASQAVEAHAGAAGVNEVWLSASEFAELDKAGWEPGVAPWPVLRLNEVQACLEADTLITRDSKLHPQALSCKVPIDAVHHPLARCHGAGWPGVGRIAPAGGGAAPRAAVRRRLEPNVLRSGAAGGCCGCRCCAVNSS